MTWCFYIEYGASTCSKKSQCKSYWI